MKRRTIFVVIATVIAGAAASVTIAACFSKPTPDCAYLCGTEGQCPDGYFCATDGACKREGLLDNFECGFQGPPDASLPFDAAIDGPPIDAAIDGRHRRSHRRLN